MTTIDLVQQHVSEVYALKSKKNFYTYEMETHGKVNDAKSEYAAQKYQRRKKNAMKRNHK